MDKGTTGVRRDGLRRRETEKRGQGGPQRDGVGERDGEVERLDHTDQDGRQTPRQTETGGGEPVGHRGQILTRVNGQRKDVHKGARIGMGGQTKTQTDTQGKRDRDGQKVRGDRRGGGRVDRKTGKTPDRQGHDKEYGRKKH